MKRKENMQVHYKNDAINLPISIHKIITEYGYIAIQIPIATFFIIRSSNILMSIIYTNFFLNSERKG